MRTRQAAAAVAVALLMQGAAAQDANPLFPLAILRADGALIPVAVYDGRAWVTLGPVADDEGAADRRPKIGLPAEWRVWPSKGGPSIRVRALKEAAVDSHCETARAFTTDWAVRENAEGWPIEKVGLAVGESMDVRLAVDIGAASEDGPKRVRAVVTDVLDALEAGLLSAAPEGQGALPRAQRQKLALRATLMRDGSAYYVEATRPFTDRRPLPQTFLQGWLSQGEFGRITVSEMRVSVDDGDGVGKVISRGTVLGIVSLPDREAWVLEEHGYESEAYAIFEPTEEGMVRVLTVNGGGC